MSKVENTQSVVLVHGLWMNGVESTVLRSRLSRSYGFVTHQFSYPTVSQSLAENAARLREFVAGMPGDTVHLVGHSLGGLVALKMLMDHEVEVPGRVVCLGSPLRGSDAAVGLARWPLGERIMGKSLVDALIEFHDTQWDGRRELGIIAGTMGLGMGQFVGKLPRPNDGTVAVAETELPGYTDHLTLRLTHSSMLFSAEAADHVAHFLRNGRFARA